MSRPARPATARATVTRKPVSHAKLNGSGPDPEDDEPDDDVATQAGDDIPAGRAPVDALSEMLASLQGATTSRITVYRVVKNQPQSYVFECDPASFSLDDLRDKYNGGEFRLYVTKDGRLFKNMRVVVEPKQMPHHAEHMAPASGMADVLAVMRDGFAAQAAALREAMASARPAPSPFSMMDIPAIITSIAGAVTALRPAVAPAPTESTSKAIDMFMQGLQLARELRDDSAPADNSIGGMLRDVLKSPIVAAAVQSAAQTQAQPQPARLPNPAAATPQPAQVSHAKPAAPQPAQPEQQVLTYYLGFLVGKAKGGADPSLYAELVLDNVPDEQLTPMLSRGDALIDDLIGLHPPVAEHRAWFVALLKEINELLAPEDDDQTQVVEQAGGMNAADTASIVVPGQPAA